jgi:hypothetical protein
MIVPGFRSLRKSWRPWGLGKLLEFPKRSKVKKNFSKGLCIIPLSYIHVHIWGEYVRVIDLSLGIPNFFQCTGNLENRDMCNTR